MPNLLYITSILPYFPGQGGLMPLHIDYLAKRNCVVIVGPHYAHQPSEALDRLRGQDLNNYWWPDPPPETLTFDVSSRPPESRWIRLVDRMPNPLQKWLLGRLTGLHKHPHSAKIWRAVFVNLSAYTLAALQTHRPSALLLCQSDTAVWLPFIPASVARTVYFHDIRSDYLKRANPRPSAIEIRRISNEELAAVDRADSCAFVSTADLVLAQRSLGCTEDVAVVPICIPTDYFTFEPVTAARSPQVVFTGNLSHPPNIDAVLYFIEAIWPLVLKSCPQATFLVVGIQPTNALTDAIAGTPHAQLITDAPDIRDHFRTSRVYVVPMRFGGGVRQKILEAWAVGLPVVATTMAVEGIRAINGKNCWIRDHPVDFANTVSNLLQTDSPNEILISGRNEVEQAHTQTVSSPMLEKQIMQAKRRRREARPKVLFDLRWLFPGKVGGVEQMSRELISELARSERTCDYRFYASRTVLKSWNLPRSFDYKCVDSRFRHRDWAAIRNQLIGRITSNLEEHDLTSAALETLEIYTRLDFTVVHGLPSYVHPDLRGFPSIVTIHDLQHLHLPEFFTPADIATRELEYRASCSRADAIICPSEFTRQDVHQRFGTPLEKIHTIPNLLQSTNQTASTEQSRKRLLRGMQLKDGDLFFFYPAQPWAHKNHLTLLNAWELARPRLPTGCLLILTGQPFPENHPAVEAYAATRSIGVRHLGYRSTAEIQALFQSAISLVFPSLFEGFGLPVVEAMQHGCPVICGRHTALTEVAESAAYLVDPRSPEAIADALVELTFNPALGIDLTSRGRAQVSRFDRRTLADQTRALYHRVHNAHFGST